MGVLPLTHLALRKKWGKVAVTTPRPSPSRPVTYEDGEKPPIPCLRVSKALDPKSPGHKYFLPQ